MTAVLILIGPLARTPSVRVLAARPRVAAVRVAELALAVRPPPLVAPISREVQFSHQFASEEEDSLPRFVGGQDLHQPSRISSAKSAC